MTLTTEDSATIDETVIDALRARSRRYDVAIDQDIVLSVLPNGVKTWTWVYDTPADPHRRTLGIYPDMSLEDARKSLAIEKDAYQRGLSEEPEFVIRDGRIEPVTPTLQFPIVIAAIAGLIAIVVIAYLLVDLKTGQEPDPLDDSSPFVVGPSENKVQLPTVSQADEDTGIHDDTDPLSDTAPEPGGISPGITNTGLQLSQYSATRQQADQSLQQDGFESDINDPPQTIQPMIRDLNKDIANAASGSVEPVESPDSKPETNAPAENVTSTLRPAELDRNSKINTDPLRQTASAATRASNISVDATAQPSTQTADVDTTTISDPRIARGQLTTAVNSREPVDDLGGEIIGNGAELQTYYFFTELHSLSGQQVRHRWLHRDEIVAEVPFNVGEAWRWRVYSSKTFIPTMSGQWRVQVVLEDDTVIHSIPFNFTP